MFARRTVALAAVIFLLYNSANAIPCDIVCMIGGNNSQHDHMHGRPSSSTAAQSVHAHHHPATLPSATLVSPSTNFVPSTMAATPACEPALISAPRFKAESSNPDRGVAALTSSFSSHDRGTADHHVSSFRDLGPPGSSPIISVLRI